MPTWERPRTARTAGGVANTWWKESALASVRERRPGIWEARGYRGRDPLTGRNERVHTTIKAPDRRSALQEANRWEYDLRREDTPTESGTFGDLYDQWTAVNKRRWSPTNTKETEGIKTRYLRELCRLDVTTIRTHGLDVFYAALEERGGRCTNRPCPPTRCTKHGPRCRRVGCRTPCVTHKGACAGWTPCATQPCEHGAPLSPATVRRVHVAVHAALEQAVAWGWIGRNPADHVSLTEVDQIETLSPELDDFVRMLAATETVDPRLAVFELVAASTGARRGAIHALRWSDLDLDSGVYAFPRVAVIVAGGVVIQTARRTKRSGAGVLDAYTLAMLRTHRTSMCETALAAGTTLDPEALVFSDHPQGLAPWRPDSTTRRFGVIRDEAGLPHIKLKALRNFMATQLLNAGVNPKTVARRGGWRKVATMLDTYARSLTHSETAAADTMGNILRNGTAK